MHTLFAATITLAIYVVNIAVAVSGYRMIKRAPQLEAVHHFAAPTSIIYLSIGIISSTAYVNHHLIYLKLLSVVTYSAFVYVALFNLRRFPEITKLRMLKFSANVPLILIFVVTMFMTQRLFLSELSVDAPDKYSQLKIGDWQIYLEVAKVSIKEEIVFRVGVFSVLLAYFRHSSLNLAIAVTLTSLIFAVFHFTPDLDPTNNIKYVSFMLFFGVTINLILLRAGLLTVWLSHALYNLAVLATHSNT